MGKKTDSAEEVEVTSTTVEEKPKKSAKVYEDDEELDDTIFLRNVARFDTTPESLKAHMEANWGETVYCLLCKDRETGESRGTAFVKFKDPESAGACLGDFEDREMQQKFFLDGRNLFVLPALNRNQMGEVKRASAKKEDVSPEKKTKKPRWYRTPASRDSNNESTSSVTGNNSRPVNKKGLRTEKRPKKNQVAVKSAKKSSGDKRRDKLASKKGKDKPQRGKDRRSQSKGDFQKDRTKKRTSDSGKKMKKTKKTKKTKAVGRKV